LSKKTLTSVLWAGVLLGLGALSWSVYGSFKRKVRADEAENHFIHIAKKPLLATAGGHAPLVAPRISDMAKVELGRDLFHDKRLSKNNEISCASCHNFARGGADGLQFSIGVGGQLGDINSPTVLNSSLNFRQFWDGRATDLTDQAPGPVHNPKEMASNWPEVIAKLNKDESMRARFIQVFGSEIKWQLIIEAIVEFERTLVTWRATSKP
jgi:cytochrome c peroxidase